ncbi:MAG: tetratricopeptide repeat protein [Magnetococcus sp. YQC-5]
MSGISRFRTSGFTLLLAMGVMLGTYSPAHGADLKAKDPRGLSRVYPDSAVPGEGVSSTDGMTTLQKTRGVDVAEQLNLMKKGTEALQKGDFDQAISSYSALVKQDPTSTDAYLNRGKALQKKGLLKEAIADYKNLLVLVPENLSGFNLLGWAYILDQRFEEAKQILLRAHQLDTWSMAITVNLGHAYLLLGDAKTAREYYQKSLPLFRSLDEFQSGPASDFALFIKNGWQVDLSKKELEQYKSAFDAEKEKIAMRAELGKRNIQVAQLFQAAKLADAIEVTTQSLTLAESRLGADHPDTALFVNHLANLYKAQSRYAAAEPLYQRALNIKEKALGANHPDTATSMSNLAMWYYALSRHSEAEPLFKRALKIKEKSLGVEHSDTAKLLNNLASLYHIQGRYAEAEPLFARALEIHQKSLGPDHPDTAKLINNQAMLHTSQGRYAQAESSFRRAWAIHEKVLGPNHPDTALTINNLALMYEKQSRFSDAAPLYQKAWKIKESTLGQDHPDTATAINNLAVLYHTQGRYGDAELLYQQALKIREKTLGTDHPETVLTSNNLGWIHVNKGDLQQAFTLFARNFRASNTFLERVMWGAGETTRQSYMSGQQEVVNGYLSLLNQMRTKETAWEASYYSLSRKGVLLRIAAEINAVARSGKHPDLQAKAEALNAKKTELSHLLFTGSDNRKRMDQLNQDVYQLEAELGSKVQALGRAKIEVDPDKVLASLKSGQVLVDFLVFQERDLKTLQFKDHRLVAVLTDPQANPSIRLVQLGAMDPVTSWVKRYRETMEESTDTRSMHEQAKKLYTLLWKPLHPFLEGKELVYLVPDGVLHLLPFKAMMDEQGKYLGQTTRLVILSSARDIVLPSLSGEATQPVIVAAPDYSVGMQKAPTKRGRQTGALRLSDIHFEFLPGTLQEGVGLSDQMRQHDAKPVLFTKASATERAVLNVKKPRILHLATHGFFLDTQMSESEAKAADVAWTVEKNRSVRAATKTQGDEQKSLDAMITLDPMNRAGLALAGANAGVAGVKNQDGTDGVLTAGKAVTLNLEGTDLVVLSACQTGVGDVRNGEGVYGLQRAFQEAGSKAVLSTLWSISDDATMAFMKSFYDRFLQGKHPQQALQETQEEFINNKKWHHPYYWAPFVMVGKD